MSRERALLVGILGLVGCAVGLVLAPRDALAAWLVCWLGLGAIPTGALALLMLVALIPGSWRRFYAPPLLEGATLMPLVAVGALPLLIGVHALYPWTDPSVTSGYPAFKAGWLSSGFFVARTLAYLIVLNFIAWALIRAEATRRAPIAAAAVIAYALIGSLLGVDFGESIQPDFHSSIYGLIALTNHWLAGTAFAILVGVWGSKQRPPRAAAGVLVTVILMWAYMHAMQFIVMWAGDIPAEARWYIERGRDGWGVLASLVFGLQGLLPFAALLSPKVRRSATAMAVLAAVTLAMRPLEWAWLVLPGLPQLGWATAPLIAAAAAAMIGLGWAAAPMLRPRVGSWNEPDWLGKTRSL